MAGLLSIGCIGHRATTQYWLMLIDLQQSLILLGY